MTPALSTPDARAIVATLDAADASVSRHLAFLAELADRRRQAVEELELDLAAARAVAEAELLLVRERVQREADGVLAGARAQAADLEASAAAEVERTLEWARAQARTILDRARVAECERHEHAGRSRPQAPAVVLAPPSPAEGVSPPADGVFVPVDAARAVARLTSPRRPSWWYDEARPFDG